MILFVIAWIGSILVEGVVLGLLGCWLDIPLAAVSQGAALGLLFVLQNHERKRLVGVLNAALKKSRERVHATAAAVRPNVPTYPIVQMSMDIINASSACGAVGPDGRLCTCQAGHNNTGSHTDGEISWSKQWARKRGLPGFDTFISKPGLPPHIMGFLRTAGMVMALLMASSLPSIACPHGRCWYPAEELSQANHPSEEMLPPGSEVCARGHVESTHHERDGDVHVWLCPSLTPATVADVYPKYDMHGRRQDCVLGEIVPSTPAIFPPPPILSQRCELAETLRFLAASQRAQGKIKEAKENERKADAVGCPGSGLTHCWWYRGVSR